jgi:hypothetical protein
MNAVTTQEALELAEQPRTAALPAVQQPMPMAVATGGEAASLIQIIASAARDPNVDIEKMERLWTMHERMRNRAAEEAFNDAMNKAQGEMGRVSADAVNPQTKSLYATYGKLDAKIRPIYTRHGFSISFNEGEGAPEGHARILAYVSHSAGHTRTYKMDMPADGKGAKGGDVMTKTHATGSAHSYGRRYLLKDIFNIAIGEEDRDGNDDDPGDKPLSELDRLKQQGNADAQKGMKALTNWWGNLTARQRSQLQADFGAMRRVATTADKEAGRA